jgi:hypothetical protein
MRRSCNDVGLDDCATPSPVAACQVAKGECNREPPIGDAQHAGPHANGLTRRSPSPVVVPPARRSGQPIAPSKGVPKVLHTAQSGLHRAPNCGARVVCLNARPRAFQGHTTC